MEKGWKILIDFENCFIDFYLKCHYKDRKRYLIEEKACFYLFQKDFNCFLDFLNRISSCFTKLTKPNFLHINSIMV